MNTDNMRETFDIPVILTKSFTDSFEAEKKNYAYKGKPLTWQQGFTKGFHEGYQAAHAASEKEIESVYQDMAIQMDLIHNYEVQEQLLEADNKRLVEEVEQLRAKVAELEKDDWISVDDRLPEGYCFAYYKNGMGNGRTVKSQYVKKHTLESGCDDDWTEYCEEDDTYYCPEGWYEMIDNWDDFTQITINHKVTHWKPLPQPPQAMKDTFNYGKETTISNSKRDA